MIDQAFRALCYEILEEGLDVFELSLGIVSKIENDNYLIVAVLPSDGAFRANEFFELKDTYCREVVESKAIIALTELENERGLCKHPLYAGLPLESYISAPIIVNDKVWGTLNFSSMKIRENKFSVEEIDLIRDRAGLIANKIIESGQ